MQGITDNGQSNHNGYIYNIYPTPKHHGTSEKKGQKHAKIQRTKMSAARLCLLDNTGKLKSMKYCHLSKT